MVLRPGASEGSTGSGLGLKRLRRRAMDLSPIRQTERSRESNLHPWFTRDFGFPWVVNSNGPGGFMICVCIIWREHLKAQPKVFLENPGIETATPG